MKKNLNIRKDQEMCQSPNKFLQMISGGGAKHCLDDVKGKPCWPYGNILGLDSPLNPEGLDPVVKIQEKKSIFKPPLLVEVYIA